MKIVGTITSVFQNDINTDDIIPGWTVQESTDRSFFKQYAFSNYDPDFIKRSGKTKNNIIIAGENFGCGSSREQAVYALSENNVAAVIAKSFPDIFYRNSLNNGLVLIKVDDITSFILNKKTTIDLENKYILNGKRKIIFLMNDIDAKTFSMGGKIAHVKNHLQKILNSKTAQNTQTSQPNNKKTQPQTIVEKIVSYHIGKAVYAGDEIEELPVDILFFNEITGPPAIKDFLRYFSDVYKKNGLTIKVAHPKKIYFVPDHTIPSSSIANSEGVTLMENFSKEQGIYCYKEGDGIEHVILAEDGYIAPGKIILGTDSHTDTNGAFNTFAFGIGITDAVYTMATGYFYDLEIPKTMRINLKGEMKKGVYAKDLILYLIGQLGVDGASKKVIEFGGQGLITISIEGRATISNMAVEMGARTAIFDYDQVLKKYLNKRIKFSYRHYQADPNCQYEKIIEIDLSTLEPCIAFPHKPDNVTYVSKIRDYLNLSKRSKSINFPSINSLKITDAFLGGCTNGRFEDFVEAAKILKGKKIHRQVNFVAIPASRKIFMKLIKEKILPIFIEAGVNIESANCGPCYGKHMGTVDKDAQVISAFNRNYIGRMGSKEAKIFLCSPATVAASAITGEITDPRQYL